MTRPKAHALPISTQRTIAKYKEKNPKVSYVQLAKMYNCTYEQAREAHKRLERGDLKDRRGRPMRSIHASGDVTGMFRTLIDTAVTALHEDTNISAIELVQMLDKVAGVLKIEQQLSLTSHLKRADAVLIAALIRRYEPQATDDDVIRIYREVHSLCQASLS
jgi:hypothetical protein